MTTASSIIDQAKAEASKFTMTDTQIDADICELADILRRNGANPIMVRITPSVWEAHFMFRPGFARRSPPGSVQGLSGLGLHVEDRPGGPSCGWAIEDDMERMFFPMRPEDMPAAPSPAVVLPKSEQPAPKTLTGPTSPSDVQRGDFWFRRFMGL